MSYVPPKQHYYNTNNLSERWITEGIDITRSRYSDLVPSPGDHLDVYSLSCTFRYSLSRIIDYYNTIILRLCRVTAGNNTKQTRPILSDFDQILETVAFSDQVTVT